jgi:predicted N-acyltransferase
LDFRFFHALEESRSIGNEAGWNPVFFTDSAQSCILYSFIKNHSYGEYIFDWKWAEAYQQNKISYYPKLTSMIPLSPVTTSHFIMPEFDKKKCDEVMDQYESFYQAHNFSSSHFLFTTNEEKEYFEGRGYQTRESFQYHFLNENYENFEDFLGKLKTKKAKNIRSERVFPELEIKNITGTELTHLHAREMYQFYLTTIDLKQGIAYLTEDFFKIIFETMKDNILYVQASLQGQVIAGALFFHDEQRLYGRYWGFNRDVPNLHFELCYYQGIEFCIKKKIKIFEAGAQGEHKITRGFRPVRTYSAHKIKHPVFAEAISQFIENEKGYVEEAIIELSRRLPFKI